MHDCKVVTAWKARHEPVFHSKTDPEKSRQGPLFPTRDTNAVVLNADLQARLDHSHR